MPSAEHKIAGRHASPKQNVLSNMHASVSPVAESLFLPSICETFLQVLWRMESKAKWRGTAGEWVLAHLQSNRI